MFLTILVTVYLFMIGYLGYRGWRGTKSTADYMVAGREIHPVIMALSYGATFISTSAIVGFGGVAAHFGGMGLLWLTVLNIFVGIFIAFVFLGGRTRAIGHHLNAHTFPELLSKRFNSKFIQGFSGLVIFLFMPLYTGVVLMGAAKFIDVRLDMVNYDTALLFFSFVVALYVFMGGLKGVMYTDAMQGGIMFVGMLLVLVLTYSAMGGVTTAHQKLTDLGKKVLQEDSLKEQAAKRIALIKADDTKNERQKSEMTKKIEASIGGMLKFKKMGMTGWTSMPNYGTPLWWILVSTIILGVGIGVLAMPQLAVRYMTVKSTRELNRAVLVGGIFILAMTGIAFVVGALSNISFYNRYGSIAYIYAGGDIGKIIPSYIESFMPAYLFDVFLVTLLAAAMSTVSSQFHAMGTAAGRDVYETLFSKSSDEKGSVMATRLGILVTFLMSVGLAYYLPKIPGNQGAAIIARGTAIFFALCAASFLPMYIGGLYSRSITKAGAIAGSIAGFAVSTFMLVFVHISESSVLLICARFFKKPTLAMAEGKPTILAFVDPLIIALPTAILVTIIVSLFTKKYSKEHLDNCFSVFKRRK